MYRDQDISNMLNRIVAAHYPNNQIERTKIQNLDVQTKTLLLGLILSENSNIAENNVTKMLAWSQVGISKIKNILDEARLTCDKLQRPTLKNRTLLKNFLQIRLHDSPVIIMITLTFIITLILTAIQIFLFSEYQRIAKILKF